MALILPVKGILPTIHESCWIAENATITGDVTIGKDSTVWFQTVIRGDVNKIRIGERTNIQDGCIIHGSYDKGDTVLGDRVSVGHRATLHGCIILDDVLVGMGATVMDDVVVESNVVIAAGALVTMGKRLESGWLYAGLPAKKIKPLDAKMMKYYISGTADHYVEYAKYYKP